jgi:predicted ATPase
MYKLYVSQDSPAYGDHEDMKMCQHFKETKVLHICNNHIFNAIRLMIMKNEIPYDQVKLYFENKEYGFDKYAHPINSDGINEWPEEMFNDRILEEMANISLERMKADFTLYKE